LGKKRCHFPLFWDKRLEIKEYYYESQFRRSGDLEPERYPMEFEEMPQAVSYHFRTAYVNPLLDEAVQELSFVGCQVKIETFLNVGQLYPYGAKIPKFIKLF